MSGSTQEKGQKSKLSPDAPLFEPSRDMSQQLNIGASYLSPPGGAYQGGGDAPYQTSPSRLHQQIPPPDPSQSQVPHTGRPQQQQRYHPSTEYQPFHQQLPQQTYPPSAQARMAGRSGGSQGINPPRSHRSQDSAQTSDEGGVPVGDEGSGPILDSGQQQQSTRPSAGHTGVMNWLTNQYDQMTTGSVSRAEPEPKQKYYVLVRNIPLGSAEKDIAWLFMLKGSDNVHGQLKDMDFRRDNRGRHTGSAIAIYTAMAAAEKAIRMQNGMRYGSSTLSVKHSNDRGDRVLYDPSSSSWPRRANEGYSGMQTDSGRYAGQYPIGSPARTPERRNTPATQPGQHSASLRPDDNVSRTSTLCVWNINYDARKADVEKHFQPRNVHGANDTSLGKVVHIEMLNDASGVFRGGALVTFNSLEVATQEFNKWMDDRAKYYGRDRTWRGKWLHIRYARPSDYDNIVPQEPYVVSGAQLSR